MAYQHIQIPSNGEKITVNAQHKLSVPDHPIIPFIEGDGIGVDITPVMRKVVDAAVKKPILENARSRGWKFMRVRKRQKCTAKRVACPMKTLQAVKDYSVAIKGPLTTPVGGGIRSLKCRTPPNFDLYVCLRPVQYLQEPEPC